MTVIGKYFMMKDGFSQPESFLEAGISKKNLDGDNYWTMGSAKYVKNAVQRVETLLGADGRALKGCALKKNKHSSLLNINYKPELEASPNCDEEHA